MKFDLIIPEIEKLVESDVLHIKGLIEKIDTKFVLIDNKKTNSLAHQGVSFCN